MTFNVWKMNLNSNIWSYLNSTLIIKITLIAFFLMDSRHFFREYRNYPLFRCQSHWYRHLNWCHQLLLLCTSLKYYISFINRFRKIKLQKCSKNKHNTLFHFFVCFHYFLWLHFFNLYFDRYNIKSFCSNWLNYFKSVLL